MKREEIKKVLFCENCGKPLYETLVKVCYYDGTIIKEINIDGKESIDYETDYLNEYYFACDNCKLSLSDDWENNIINVIKEYGVEKFKTLNSYEKDSIKEELEVDHPSLEYIEPKLLSKILKEISDSVDK